jgi:hypothetical protein
MRPLISPRSDLAGTDGAGPADGYAFRLAGGREAGKAARRAVDDHDGDLPPREASAACAWFEVER